MTSFEAFKYVLYLEEWKVFICLHEKCRHCLSPESIARHMQKYHQVIYDRSLHRQIVKYAKTLNLCLLSEIEVPTNTPPPIPGLKIHKG